MIIFASELCTCYNPVCILSGTLILAINDNRKRNLSPASFVTPGSCEISLYEVVTVRSQERPL